MWPSTFEGNVLLTSSGQFTTLKSEAAHSFETQFREGDVMYMKIFGWRLFNSWLKDIVCSAAMALHNFLCYSVFNRALLPVETV
jgi:hypothetical protein